VGEPEGAPATDEYADESERHRKRFLFFLACGPPFDLVLTGQLESPEVIFLRMNKPAPVLSKRIDGFIA
jgi:hypothetical protein